DGASLTFFVTDDRSVYPARVSVTGGAVAKLMSPPVVVSSWTSSGACAAVVSGGDAKPTEVYRADGWSLKQLTHQNEALLASLQLGPTEEVSFTSKDGTEVHGLLTKPVGYVAGTKVPLLLRIHGGPKDRKSTRLNSSHEWISYAVFCLKNK